MHKAVCYAIARLLVVWLGFNLGIVHAYPKYSPRWSKVEKKFLASSGRQAVYPHEYVPVIETRNQYELGKLTALSFIEWAITHPNGVIALTSGNTPQFFIKFLNYYKKGWHNPEVKAELQSLGITAAEFPDTSNMKFVQLEELYPIHPQHYKNVTNYVKRHYINFFGIKKENTLLMDLASKGILAEKGMKVVFMNGKIDLSIMQRKAATQLEKWQQQAIKEAKAFCIQYENRIREWGGIDFYLGSIGYSGDLGFNQSGGELNSKTHIVKLDYREAAYAAKDFGGIEHAKGKVAITIGLGTISIKPNSTMIIIVAGEAKAPMLRDAIENKTHKQYPASYLQNFPNAKFYITAGAAKQLNDRRTEDITINSKYGWTQKLIQEVLIEIAQTEKKPIISLSETEVLRYERGRLLLESPPKPLSAMLADVQASLIAHIEKGLKLTTIKANRILHTGPHHDDIILGYYPLIDNLVHRYQNHFAHITSGFNSVSDNYVLATLNRANDWWLNKEANTIFNTSYDKVIGKFRNYFAKQDIEQMNMLDTIIALKHLVSVFEIKDLNNLKQTIRWLKDDYFPGKQPGDMDIEDVRKLKGMIRESEADRLLSLKNVQQQNISHLRSKFYTSKEFPKIPRLEADVVPFLKLFNTYKPDILTVDDDPQSAPPVTHYKVMQIIAQALRNKDAVLSGNLMIWGYRNIWFRYRVQDANMFVPVSESMLEAQRRAYLNCFNTQKSATFPSPFFEGDFSELTAKIQKEQLEDLKLLLGADYFAKSPIPELRSAAGFVFINQMSLNQFLQRAEDLQQALELEKSFEERDIS